MYRFSENEDLGILVVHARGGWAPDVAERFIQDLLIQVPVMRERHGCFRMLIDSRDEDTPSVAVLQAFDGIERKLGLSKDDRIATIVNTQSRKLQTRRLYVSRKICAFVSESSALLWLTGQMQAVEAPKVRIGPSF